MKKIECEAYIRSLERETHHHVVTGRAKVLFDLNGVIGEMSLFGDEGAILSAIDLRQPLKVTIEQP